MSGWIKFEKDLIGDPRVRRVARLMRNADVTHERIDPVTQRFGEGVYLAIVLGGLTRLWCYADTHVRDDDTIETTADDINEVVGIQGFAQLLPEDWFQILDAETVKLPGFHSHNGTDAKKKALTQKRVSNHRERVTLKNLNSERKRNADVTLDALPDQDQDLYQDQDLRACKEARAKPTKIEEVPRGAEAEGEIQLAVLSIKAKFPKAPHEDWITAEKGMRNIVLRGEMSWFDLEQAVERYAKYCRSTNRIVKNPGNWFTAGDRPWLSDWDLPKNKAESLRDSNIENSQEWLRAAQ